MLTRFFIDRPVFAWVLSLVIVLLGAAAAVTLPITEYPPITPPTVQVIATYPGANATVVAPATRPGTSMAALAANQLPGALTLLAAGQNRVIGQASEAFDRRQPEHVILAGTINHGLFDSRLIEHHRVIM